MAIIDILNEICSLQPLYASQNTPEMRRRGVLIRSALPDAIRALSQELVPILDEFGDDFLIDASDGIGRKTEAPWVRIASRRMSPSPREGYYVVIHFSRDGSAFWITIGFGSTVWANGELRPVADDELGRRRAWARREIQESFATLAPFTDDIALGANASLPRTFEKATAIAERFDPLTANQAAVIDSLKNALARLTVLYRRQNVGADLTSGQQAELDIESVANPVRASSALQGFGLTGPERKAIELRAMALAREWLEGEGYAAKDCSASASFDFEARRGGLDVKVEVKGSTSASLDAFVMTKNEVDLHQRERGSTMLILVSAIRLDRAAMPPVADGGQIEVIEGWDINTFDLEPMAYRVRRAEPG